MLRQASVKNSKKSWHPNTMKNQERVWKAEQAVAEEKKRIVELQRERDVERDRTELNNMVKKTSGIADDNRLHWMYDKPNKKVQEEDFLLGKAIDKNTEQSGKVEVVDPIPAVGRRVVGSSMLTSGGDTQVDIARKIREDPLLLIKERERAARAALLNNPLQRKKLTELLQKEQAERKKTKNKNKHKKKDKDLDNMLASKLSVLGGDKGIDLTTLLNSDDSSSDSSSEEEKSKKKKKKRKKEKLKKKKKSNKKKRHNSSDDSDESKTKRSKKDFNNKKMSNERNSSPSQETRKRKSDNSYSVSDHDSGAKKHRIHQDTHNDRESKSDSRKMYDSSYRSYSSVKKSPVQSKCRSEQRSGLTDEERALRLAAMASAGAEREVERSRRVAEQRALDEAGAKRPGTQMFRNEARSLPDSVESRIHSNRHNIQRNSRHMSEHFARR